MPITPTGLNALSCLDLDSYLNHATITHWQIWHLLILSSAQEAFANYVNKYFVGTFGTSVESYDQQYLKNTTPAESCKSLL